MLKKLLFTALSLLISSTSHAALVFTIDTYTTDQLSFTLGGTFDAATIGDQPGWLAIKNDWSNNQGVHTEMFAGLPTISLNTILVGGLAPSTSVQNSSSEWMDDILFANPLGTSNAIAAGTTVSGSLTLLGLGIFDPTDEATLELLSGFDNSVRDWVRLEASTLASVVPIPAAVWLFGTALMGLVGFGKRRKTI